ncbi:AbrB family transcriptional regulator [Bosea sp. 117]|uniref:AbrB family transcriptional regulator n=1 Tax=Bosea sp. 117 TaxID=1125973 RepID=UPI000493F43E|nr:AbrB family transcriptional regulator [Bosea sp. 117]
MPLKKFLKGPLAVSPRLPRYVLTFALAALGGGLFAYAGMPAGWLSGALVAVAVAALFGVPVAVQRRVREATFIVLGTSMGAAITPATLHSLASWPATMAVLMLSLPVMMVAAVFYLERVAGWDRRTAFFAAAPGALSAVLVMSESTGADTRRVAFSQSLRLFVLVALLPPALGGLGHQPAGVLPVTPVVNDAWSLLLSLAVGITGGLLAMRLRFPGGPMVGSMLASGVVHGSGLIEGRLPDLLLIAGFVILGANTGSRFAGTKLETLKSFLVHSLASFAITTAVALAFAGLGACASGEPYTKVLMSYVPGALEAMTIMAFVLALDPAFVAAHHLARFLGLSLAIPVVVRLFFGRAAVPSEHVPVNDEDETKD